MYDARESNEKLLLPALRSMLVTFSPARTPITRPWPNADMPAATASKQRINFFITLKLCPGSREAFKFGLPE